MKKLGSGETELPNITRILRVKSPVHLPDSYLFSMMLCPFLYVLILSGCYQPSTESGTLRKSGPLQKAWPDLAVQIKLPGISGISLCKSDGWCWLQWSMYLFFFFWCGYPLRPRVYDCEHWLRYQLPTERKDRQGVTRHNLVSVPGNTGVNFFYFISFFWGLPECTHSSCSIILKVWCFWQLKPSVPLACYSHNVSKRKALHMAWWAGKAGIGVLSGSLLL